MKIIVLFIELALVGTLIWYVRKRWAAFRSGQRLQPTPLQASRPATAPAWSGRWLILVSAACAVLSMSATWAKFLFWSLGAVELGAALLLLAWRYPVVCALWRIRLHRSLAATCAVVAAVGGLVAWIQTIDAVLYFNVTGVGVYIYLAAAAMLVIGVSRFPKRGHSRATGDQFA